MGGRDRSQRNAVAATGAILLLTPLKKVEPFIVRVDSSTGIVDVVPGYAGTAELPEVVTRHLVTQYVTQRERYIPAIAEVDYDEIGAYHSAAMNQAWALAWERSNPDSPLNRYADGTHVRAQVQSVSFLKHVRAALISCRYDFCRRSSVVVAPARSYATLSRRYRSPLGLHRRTCVFAPLTRSDSRSWSIAGSRRSSKPRRRRSRHHPRIVHPRREVVRDGPGRGRLPAAIVGRPLACT